MMIYTLEQGQYHKIIVEDGLAGAFVSQAYVKSKKHITPTYGSSRQEVELLFPVKEKGKIVGISTVVFDEEDIKFDTQNNIKFHVFASPAIAYTNYSRFNEYSNKESENYLDLYSEWRENLTN